MKMRLFLFTAIWSLIFYTSCNSGVGRTQTGAPQESSTQQLTLTQQPHPVEFATPQPLMVPSNEGLQRTVPNDIIEEVMFYGTGGDPGPWDAEPYPSPTLVDVFGDSLELPGLPSFLTCGWQRDEIIRIEITFPDGRVEVIEEQAYYEKLVLNNACVKLWIWNFYLGLEAPLGEYKVKFIGIDGVVDTTFYAIDRRSSGMYLEVDGKIGDRVLFSSMEFEENQKVSVYLQGLNPNERVRLFVYEEVKIRNSETGADYHLVGWLEFLANSDGILFINTGETCGDIKACSGNGYEYVVVGDSSGEMQLAGPCGLTPIWDPTLSDKTPLSDSHECSGAPTQQVNVGDTAQVCTAYDRLNVRSSPTQYSDVVTQLDPGRHVTIIAGPECADACSWWKISTESGTVGWVAEGGDEVDPYFICPAD